MINQFSDEAKGAGSGGQDFPIEGISAIANRKNRSDVLYYHQFIAQPWLALKVLTPHRTYVFFDSKPQVDHIFPLALQGADDSYRSTVDVIWNFQPLHAGINNFKRAKHPKEFFGSDEGSKFFSEYDYLPEKESRCWDSEKLFIWSRHKRMRTALRDRYSLSLKRLRE